MSAPFSIDTERRRLWRGGREVALAPKPLELLCAFVERPGDILTRDELQARIWPDVKVTDGVLRYTLRQLRQTLGDDVDEPRYVETVPRRGWKLVAQVREGDSPGSKQIAAAGADAPAFLGREAEISRIDLELERARVGEPRLVFVTGEAGIGKTTLLRAAMRRAAATGATTAVGECIQHYGSEEPYVPAIEALDRLVRALEAESTVASLRRYAPSWLALLPGLANAHDLAELAPAAMGTTSTRMLRQLARFLEDVTSDKTLVLAFDDVHWSDTASLELLAFLVRRPQPLRLLLIATLRPAEVAARPGPLVALKRDLEIHGLCEEIVLSGLAPETVSQYVSRRMPEAGAKPKGEDLGAFVHRWTEGNPLFMVSVVDQLEARGATESPPLHLEAPTTVRRLIEDELERVNPEHRAILETASVAGMEFSAATVAAGARVEIETVEAYCEELILSGRFLKEAGDETWPDGTIASTYRFGHALYREILREGLPAARRARMHRQIGLRREKGWEPDTAPIAAELAHHFDQADDAMRALQYYAVAGDRAARRYANREAAGYLRKALRLSAARPSSPERDAEELVLRLAVSAPLAAIQGYASPDLAENLGRIAELADPTRASESALPVLLGLWSLHIVRGDLDAARGLGERLLDIAAESESPITRLQAHRVVGGTCFFAGEFAEAIAHLDTSLEGYDVEAHAPLDYSFGDDPVVLALSYSALVLWFLGESDLALERADRATAKARELGHPPSLAFALSYAGILHQLRREPARALATAEELLSLTEEEAVPLWFSLGQILRGWAWATLGEAERGIAELRVGLAGWEATGADLARPHYIGLLAEVLGRAGRVDEGLELLAEAGRLIERTGQHAFEPDRWRLEAELLARAGRPGVEKCRGRAAASAHELGARALETVTSGTAG